VLTHPSKARHTHTHTHEEAYANAFLTFPPCLWSPGLLCAILQYHIAVSTDAGVTIGEPESADTNWEIADLVKGYE